MVYFADDKTPAFGVQIKHDNEGDKYRVWTSFEWFDIRNGKIFNLGENGNDMIPLVEYPNNERRLRYKSMSPVSSLRGKMGRTNHNLSVRTSTGSGTDD